jgi:hypothetical protein
LGKTYGGFGEDLWWILGKTYGGFWGELARGFSILSHLMSLIPY